MVYSIVFYPVNLIIMFVFLEDVTKSEKTRKTSDQSLRHKRIFRPPSACRLCGQRVQLQACQVYSPALKPVATSFSDHFKNSKSARALSHIFSTLIGTEDARVEFPKTPLTTSRSGKERHKLKPVLGSTSSTLYLKYYFK
uniref:Putative secreted protein n=1 Tax=Ixodes ricinus TaxID=34613 RepID=A0A6B0UT17_IXORI